MLSHYNIGSNIEQLEQVFGLNRADGFVGVLPFFHSFGFTGTLCLPAVLGVRVVYHPNPLEAKAIGPLVSQHALTFLLATPTFLQLYMRGCAAEDFGSLRVVMTARGETARAAGRRVRGAIRHPPARRLRLHRMRAGGGGQHPRLPLGGLPADRRQARQDRPPAARRQRAHRGPGDFRGRK